MTERTYLIGDLELTQEEYLQHRVGARHDEARKRWLKRSGIEVRFRQRDLSVHTWPAEATRRVDAWTKRFLAGEVTGELAETSELCGKGLLLDGPQGAGKTTLATKIALDVIRQAPLEPVSAFCQGRSETPSDRWSARRPVYYTRMEDLLNIHKALFNRDVDALDPENEFQEIVHGITGLNPEWAISLLVIDDVAKEYRTDFSLAALENITRRRFGLGLATIVTSNVPREDWSKVYSASVGSFAYEAFLHVPIISPTGDRRRV